MNEKIAFKGFNLKTEEHLVHVNIEPDIKSFHGLLSPLTSSPDYKSLSNFSSYDLMLSLKRPFNLYQLKAASKHNIINLDSIDPETCSLIIKKLKLTGCKGKKSLIEALAKTPSLIDKLFLIPSLIHLHALIITIRGNKLVIVNKVCRLKNTNGASGYFNVLDTENRKLAFNSGSVERVDINDLLLMG